MTTDRASTEMDGLESLAELRKLAPDVHVIMMTAYAEMETVKAAWDSGLVQAHLQKPFDLDKLRLLVKSALADNEGRGQELNSARQR
jgi:DNA-binding NtrC family response regulator